MKKNKLFKIDNVKIIKNAKGDLFKIVSKKHNFFTKFGELYFSEVYPKKFKGWKFHKKRHQIMTVASGKVRFFFKKEIDQKKIFSVDISFSNNLKLLKIFPKTYYSFECKSKKKALLINLINEVVG